MCFKKECNCDMDYLEIETDEGTVLIDMDDPQLTELLDIYDPIVKNGR